MARELGNEWRAVSRINIPTITTHNTFTQHNTTQHARGGPPVNSLFRTWPACPWKKKKKKVEKTFWRKMGRKKNKQTKNKNTPQCTQLLNVFSPA